MEKLITHRIVVFQITVQGLTDLQFGIQASKSWGIHLHRGPVTENTLALRYLLHEPGITNSGLLLLCYLYIGIKWAIGNAMHVPRSSDITTRRCSNASRLTKFCFCLITPFLALSRLFSPFIYKVAVTHREKDLRLYFCLCNCDRVRHTSAARKRSMCNFIE